MAILTYSGRAAYAAALASRPLHLAWGAGDPAWDGASPPVSVDITSLVSEVGRRVATTVRFCVEDENGEVESQSKRFRIVTEPTNNLYMRFDFDYGDSPSATIRELAIFSGTAVKSGMPAGQSYFLPSDIADPGILVAVDRIPATPRTSNTAPSFALVLTV